MLHFDDNPRCFARHMGEWAVKPRWMAAAVAAVQDGTLAAEPSRSEESTAPVTLSQGVAIVPVHGAMMKQRSKFGGVSTLDVRKALHAANMNDDVRGILLHVDSPGGHVSGVTELAADVAMSRKPVHVFAEDLIASAAYWASSGASHITVNQAGVVGSLGSYAVLTDSSEAAERDGIKVHVVSSGELKGTAVPGTPITDDVLAEVQERVDYVTNLFKSAVQMGRVVDNEDIDAMFTGKTWNAVDALKLGLVDEVGSFEDAFQNLYDLVQPRSTRRRDAANARIRNAR